jgi:hypothetical protein
MSTSKKHLISFRSNTKFSLNYDDQNLTPQVELIILSHEPEYKLNTKGEIMKGSVLGEFRIFTSLDGINAMIGELQLLAAQLQTFEQLSVGMNSLINNAKKKKEEEDKKINKTT